MSIDLWRCLVPCVIWLAIVLGGAYLLCQPAWGNRRENARRIKLRATRITARLLEQHRACERDVSMFERKWPEGVLPSRQAFEDASDAGLDLFWFSQHMLTPRQAMMTRLLGRVVNQMYYEVMAEFSRAHVAINPDAMIKISRRVIAVEIWEAMCQNADTDVLA